MGGVKFADGLYSWHGLRWARAIARKHATCRMSGKPIVPGEPIYRPISNGSQRMFRVLASEMEKWSRP